MPRPLRVQYPGARYHVMCRGNRGAVVFADQGDLDLFLKTLGEAVGKTDWRVHAYALMSTHYHLLLETPSANLVDGMSWFQGTFTQRMNAKHKTWGHLFQGRYKPKVISDDDPTYFRTVADYIHLNPAEAGLLGHGPEIQLEAYPWSSYPAYLHPKRRPGWLVVEDVLGSHHLVDTPKGRKAFEALMSRRALEAAVDPACLQGRAMERGWVHGTQEFRQRMIEMLLEESEQPVPQVYDREQRREVGQQAARRVMDQALAALGVTAEDLSSLKKGDPTKLALATFIKQNYRVPNTWISEQLHMGHPSLVGRCQQLVAKDTACRKLLRALEREIKIT